jgi:hypothetical protein
MSVAELDRERTSEGQTDQMRFAEREALDEPGEAIGVGRHPERIRRIR